jgi:N-acetylmuramoyl-L-alanine amidase
MTSIRIAASAIFLALAHTAVAQSGTPSTPAPPAQAAPQPLKLPPSSPPPPRPAAVVPASQRTPTPPLGVRPVPDAGLVKPSSMHPDSARAAAARTAAARTSATATVPPALPAARVNNPPRVPKTAATPVVSANMVAAQPRPDGATMRCKDGTYITGTASADRCANNGGVTATFPAASAPPPPRPQPQKRP